MRRELRRVQRYLLPLFFVFFAILSSGVQNASGQVFSGKDKAVKIAYSDRLQFYMDRISKDYLVEMAANEKMLLQMITNVAAEIKSRGTETILEDEPNFVPLYSAVDKLVSDYGQELDQVLSLISQIDSLKIIMEQEQRYGMADQFASLKDSLVTLIDNRKLHKFLPQTKKDLSNLLQEYNFEVDSLVAFYGKLSLMERRLDPVADRELLDRIAIQKNNISEYLKIAAKDSSLIQMTDAYTEEANQLVKVLSEIDEMQKQAVGDNPNLLSDIENVKRDVLSQMDARIVDLMGYRDYAPRDSLRLSEIFKEWRLTRLTDFETRLHEYLVMKSSLIESADDNERARMLQRDVSDAFLNYVDGRYTLAELQLDRLIEDYGQHYSTFESVYFFRAESKYARLHYQQAYGEYKELLQAYPDNQYKEDTYLRLMTIAQTLGWREDFFQYYGEFQNFEESVGAKVRNRIHYLAGYYSLQLRDAEAAQAALAKVEQGSKYHLPGLYLTGITQAVQGFYEEAIQTLKKIVGMENIPWADPNLAVIRNNALLKLGFIYYERGEYHLALSYFEAVSRGAEDRDKVLIGTAWASMKTGAFEQSVDFVDELFRNFLSSQYSYEALALAAHCKRLLNQPDEAMRDFRYVTKARGVLEMANDYNDERQNILLQLDELERVEESLLYSQSKKMFDMVAEMKSSMQERLLRLGYESEIGTQLSGAFDSERTEIHNQIRELDTIIASARQVGNAQVLGDAKIRRDRLVKTLAAYQSDKIADKKMNFFLDYPLATKESSAKYRKQIVQDLLRDMDNEKRRIDSDLASLQELMAQGNGRTEIFVDFKALKLDLETLQDRTDRFQAWLSTYQIDDVETDFDHWADFSGFGISDIALRELHDRDEKIATYSKTVVSIDNLLKRRKFELENRLARFDEELNVMRKELQAEQLRLEKLEREKVFESLYFDKSTRETKG